MFFCRNILYYKQFMPSAVFVALLINVLLTKSVDASGPLRRHHSNPRYFTDDSGRPIYLTGSHTWDNRQDFGTSRFDFHRYLTFLKEHNHNFVRFWIWEQSKGLTTSPPPANPFADLTPEVFARTGPGIAADGGLKFDLTKFNSAHFDRLRERIIDAGARGIYMSVMLFDGWSIEKKSGGVNPWTYHPFNRRNNINGVDGDPNGDGNGSETHTLLISDVTELQEAYVRKVIDTINDLDNVLFEISNESNAESLNWQYHMITYIKSYEARKPKKHPVGMTVCWPEGSNAALFNSPADWISPNNMGGYKNDPPASAGDKIIVVDTDHLWGIGGNRGWAWKSFTRGLNVLYMDPWDGAFIRVASNDDLRLNMGYISSYANRINLAAMTPRGDLSSSGFCLANAAVNAGEYLIYLPSPGTVTVNLTASAGELSVEWFDPDTSSFFPAGTTFGGAVRVFTSPFNRDAVLYIYSGSRLPDLKVKKPLPLTDYNLIAP